MEKPKEFYQDKLSENKDGSVLVVKVTSAGFTGGNFAEILINNLYVRMEKNVNGHERGLHLVVLNPTNGNIELAQIFDTYKSSE